MNLELIVTHLEEEGVAIAGKSVFVNFIPDGMSGLLLRDQFGGVPIDHELPGYNKGSFMLISRAPGYAQSRVLMDAAIVALKTLAGKEIDGVVFKFARARATPFAFAPSPGQQNEFHTTVDVNFVDTNEPTA